MIGMATRAGKTVSGEFAVSNAVKKNKALLVVVAEDASLASKKSYADMCSFYKVSISCYGTKEELGRFCGKEYRAAVAICDEGLAKSIERLLSEQKEMN